ncbi:MAG: hypothetical protein AB8B64_21215 [Granulosicoccus sp.]
MNSLRRESERLELAEKSDDPDVLARLCTDRESDVRRTVARREELSCDQLLLLCQDSDPLVGSTALSTLAKATMNQSQHNAYQEILRDIAIDEKADISMLREVIYNLNDHSILAKLYIRCQDSHIKAGIIRRIHAPDILEAEIVDIIRRKAGERRVDNILCNPTLTREQVMALIKARKLSPIDTMCTVESADALLGIAELCNPTTITRDHSVMADLTKDQLEKLVAIDERYLSIAFDQLYKLDTERRTAVFRRNEMIYGWLQTAG